jgi:hypothetical protein
MGALLLLAAPAAGAGACSSALMAPSCPGGSAESAAAVASAASQCSWRALSRRPLVQEQHSRVSRSAAAQRRSSEGGTAGAAEEVQLLPLAVSTARALLMPCSTRAWGQQPAASSAASAPAGAA